MNKPRNVFIIAVVIAGLASGFVGKSLFDTFKVFCTDLGVKNADLAQRAYSKGQGDMVGQMLDVLSKEGKIVLNLKDKDGKPVAVTLVPQAQPKAGPGAQNNPETRPSKK